MKFVVSLTLYNRVTQRAQFSPECITPAYIRICTFGVLQSISYCFSASGCELAIGCELHKFVAKFIMNSQAGL